MTGADAGAGVAEMMGYDYGGGAMLLWGVLRVLLLGGVGLGLYGLLRRQPTGQGPATHEDPLQLLAQRYARGDLDGEAYLQARRDMQGRG